MTTFPSNKLCRHLNHCALTSHSAIAVTFLTHTRTRTRLTRACLTCPWRTPSLHSLTHPQPHLFPLPLLQLPPPPPPPPPPLLLLLVTCYHHCIIVLSLW